MSVDLGNVYEIHEVRLYPRNEGAGFPVDYEVQISLNGTSWETVALRSEVDGGNDVYVETIKALPARYVRFVGTKLRQDATTGLFGLKLVGLEVY